MVGIAWMRRAGHRLARMFGYDATASSPRRTAPRSVAMQHEDDVLDATNRKRLLAATRDVHRNFALAGWALRKHLDFVSTFSFSSRLAETDPSQAGLDDQIEALIARHSEPEMCDAAGTHSLRDLVRITEACATLHGDHFWLLLDDGRVQQIESDRVRWDTLRRRSDEMIFHGVRVDSAGRPIAYAIHRRLAGGLYEFERWVPSENVAVRGYYDRADQVRGISPLAPALNTLRDLYEGFDYALGKLKIAQLLGIVTKRQDDSALVTPKAYTNASEEGEETERYQIDLGTGIWHLDLEPGDDVQLMHANVPGDAFESYTSMMMSLVLLALDLPWNFYKVDATNFFGSRAALNLYLMSTETKRAANRRLLDRWTRWQLQRAVLSGELRLPGRLTIDDLRWQWTPRGLPWWNPVQEAEGAIRAIGAGLDSPQRVCQQTGSNVFDNIDQIAEVMDYARRKGVPLSFAMDGALNET